MKIINKKLSKISILLFIALMLAAIAYAYPFTSSFSNGLLSINNFFSGQQYQPYAKAVDFFFFSLLFISVYMMGARYAFKEMKRPEQVIVILLGLMTAFLLVLAGFSATLLLPYIHWILYLMLFLFYWWLLKGIKNNFWRFVLALLLTILTIALMQGLFDYLRKSEIPSIQAPEIGGFGGYFKDLFGGFKGISMPGVSAPGIPDWLKPKLGIEEKGAISVTQLPPTTKLSPTPTPSQTPPTTTSWYKNLWWLLPLLLLVALGIWRRGGEKPKKRVKEEGEEEDTTEVLTIEKMINEILSIINKKRSILKRVQDIITEKNNLTWELKDLYYKVLKKFDKSFWIDPDSIARQNFDEQDRIVYSLIENEIRLEKELKDLQELEKKLLGYDVKGVIEVPFTGKTKILRFGLAFKWLETVAKLSHEKTEQLNEEIKRFQGTPLLLREKIIAFFKSLILEFPEKHRIAIEKIMGIIADLISAYKWNQEELALRVRDPLNKRGDEKLVSGYIKDENGSLKRNADGSVMRYELEPEDIQLMQQNEAICDHVLRYINYYFLIARDEKYKQKAWKKLISIKEMEKWLRNQAKWVDIRKKIFGDASREPVEILREHFAYEEKFFATRFRPAVMKQLQHLYMLIKYLKYLQELPEDVVMQPLRVEYTDENNEVKQLSDAEARNVVIPRNKLIRVFCRVDSGNGPYTLGCYIDRKVIRGNQLVRGSTDRYLPMAVTINETEGHPVVEWTSEMFGNHLTDGTHEYPPTEEYPPRVEYPPIEYPPTSTQEVTFYLVKKQVPRNETPQLPIAQKWRDVKSITLNISGTPSKEEYPPVEYPGKRINLPTKEYPVHGGPPPYEYPQSPEQAMRNIKEGGQLYNYFNFFRENVKIQIPRKKFPPLNVLHLSIPRGIKAGVVIAVDNLFKYEKEYGMRIELITHWYNSVYNFFGTINQTNIVNKESILTVLANGNFIPEVTHVHTQTFEYDKALTTIKNKFSDIPIILTLHQLIPHAYMSKDEKEKLDESQEEDVQEIMDRYYSSSLWKGHAKAQKDSIEASDGVIAISNSQLKFFKKLFKNYKGESIAIENGVDLFNFINDPNIDSKAVELLNKYNLWKRRIILFIGRIEPGKGYQRTLKTFLQILENPIYKNSKLIFVGGYVPGIENKILSEGIPQDILKNNIIFTSWTNDRSELAAWYRLGTVLINPMITDNLYSMVAKEAICMGLPTIACKGDMSIGQSKSDNDIYKSLIYVFENPEKVKEHILRAFDICIKYHSVYTSIEQHLEFYNKLIGKIKKEKPQPTPSPEPEKLKTSPIKILTLTPLNIRPNDPIQIASIYHIFKQGQHNGITIGKGSFNNIDLADAKIEGVHAIIYFVNESKEFAIVEGQDESIIKINEKGMGKSALIPATAIKIQINEYLFDAKISEAETVAPEDEYKKMITRTLRLI